LFGVGLSIQVWNLHKVVAAPVIALTIVAAMFYLAATVLPFIYEFYPYSTTLSRLVTSFWDKKRKNRGAADMSNDVPMDVVTSRALSWVISNCENSNSVDTALQAIAGADHSLPCEPLWD
ncbi:hypothetical protein FRC07_014171, partial [Ceratobasidium sp. 392]